MFTLRKKISQSFAKDFNKDKLRKKFSFLLHEYQAQDMLKSFGVVTPKVSTFYFLRGKL